MYCSGRRTAQLQWKLSAGENQTRFDTGPFFDKCAEQTAIKTGIARLTRAAGGIEVLDLGKTRSRISVLEPTGQRVGSDGT
jgi:hypothetical protein